MKIQKEHYYNIPSSELLTIFTDEHYFQTRFKNANPSEYEIEHFGERDGKFVITIRRTVAIRPPAKLPGVAKRLIKEKNAIITRIKWDLNTGDHAAIGEYRFELEGMPGEVSGTTIVKPTDSGCINQLNLTVRNSIPLVGKKINAMVGEKIEKGLSKEYKSTLEYIEQYRSDRDDESVVG